MSICGDVRHFINYEIREFQNYLDRNNIRAERFCNILLPTSYTACTLVAGAKENMQNGRFFERHFLASIKVIVAVAVNTLQALGTLLIGLVDAAVHLFSSRQRAFQDLKETGYHAARSLKFLVVGTALVMVGIVFPKVYHMLSAKEDYVKTSREQRLEAGFIQLWEQHEEVQRQLAAAQNENAMWWNAAMMGANNVAPGEPVANPYAHVGMPA